MSRGIKPEAMGQALEQALTLYRRDVTQRLDRLSSQAVKVLVAKTRATAPVGARKKHYRDSIDSKRLSTSLLYGSTYVWYVRPPDYRLTHLLVHGHATPQGGRTRGNDFLVKAVETVRTQFEKDVEAMLKK